jgi:hypothetical protein
MKRRIVGLGLKAASLDSVTAGLFLVEVAAARFVRNRSCVLDLRVLEPQANSGTTIATELELTSDRIWKLAWLLKDFGYDEKLLSLDQVDCARLRGLIGVVKISESDLVSGRTYRIDACAPSSEWKGSDDKEKT